MKSIRGLTKGIDESLRGAAGVFEIMSNKTFGRFSTPTKQDRPNIEYLDEMLEDHSVPRYYPDLDEQDDFSAMPRNVANNTFNKKQDSEEEEEDFLVIESTKIEPTCQYRYLPFNQTLEMCTRKVQNWLQQIWFLPSDWRTSLRIMSPKPVYVPFFVFDVTTSTNYEATILLDAKDTSKKWTPAAGMPGGISNQYSEIMACASCSVSLKLVHKLLSQSGFSYQSQRVLPSDSLIYQQSTMCSEQVLPLEITKEESWENSGRLRVQEWEEQRAKDDINSKYEILGSTADCIRTLRLETRFTNFTYYVILLPIYFTGFEYASQTYEVLVSGNLGLVVGNRPVGTGAGGRFLLDKLKSVGNLVSETVPL